MPRMEDAANRLPDGPRSALGTTLRSLRDPYGSLPSVARTHGDPFLWPTFLGKRVVTVDPEGVGNGFSANPETYRALGAELLGPIIGERSRILLSGERHRMTRKLQTPPFAAPRMREHGHLILAIAAEQAGRFARACATRPSAPRGSRCSRGPERLEAADRRAVLGDAKGGRGSYRRSSHTTLYSSRCSGRSELIG